MYFTDKVLNNISKARTYKKLTNFKGKAKRKDRYKLKIEEVGSYIFTATFLQNLYEDKSGLQIHSQKIIAWVFGLANSSTVM